MKASDINKHRELDGKSIVHWAVINDRNDVLDAAITHANAKVNAMDASGKTGLHYAAELDLFRIARQLLRHGVSARIQDLFGRTPVLSVAVEVFLITLRLLLHESNSDPDDADEQETYNYSLGGFLRLGIPYKNSA